MSILKRSYPLPSFLTLEVIVSILGKKSMKFVPKYSLEAMPSLTE